ncbi:hypothetical protein EJ04DRAFT_357754 [Polyplosphaeria fusca]|uniref:Uncharacterized protein n=1 Tax=Polyplosphaeria fusca TaxID=682080 RepID=A0A9P4R8Z0_9PLEO|nr:hypothetical protein EJ04DRAFT_357754 [Polyplosphaeria fusca]
MTNQQTCDHPKQNTDRRVVDDAVDYDAKPSELCRLFAAISNSNSSLAMPPLYEPRLSDPDPKTLNFPAGDSGSVGADPPATSNPSKAVARVHLSGRGPAIVKRSRSRSGQGRCTSRLIPHNHSASPDHFHTRSAPSRPIARAVAAKSLQRPGLARRQCHEGVVTSACALDLRTQDG